jgi:DNA topoisomerase-2
VPEYEIWKMTEENQKNLKIKYYKGLGTSTAREAKEYFTAIERHKIDFEYVDNEDDE